MATTNSILRSIEQILTACDLDDEERGRLCDEAERLRDTELEEVSQD